MSAPQFNPDLLPIPLTIPGRSAPRFTVTITGADDAVDPRELAALSQEFPFVEWGILVSETRAGEPRYPTQPWMERLLSCGQLRLSAHYCGRAMRELTRHRTTYPVRWARRVQLNGWSPGDSDLVDVFHGSEVDPILQCRTEESIETCRREAVRLAEEGIAAGVLVDPSGGTGASIEDVLRNRLLAGHILIAASGIKVGLAGGIGPTNVDRVLTRALAMGASWIDMESGVRANNLFDIERVRAVLETCRGVLKYPLGCGCDEMSPCHRHLAEGQWP